MNTQSIVRAFGMYIGIKLHFTNETFYYSDSFYERYDESSLDGRKKDIDLFIELGGMYENRFDDLKEKLITLFMVSKRGYIIDLFGRNEKFENAHLERTRNISNLTNVIENDITELSDYMETHNLALSDILDFKGDRPLLIKKLKLSNEFIALLDSRNQFLDQQTDNPLWGKRKFALQKYKTLIQSNERIEKMFDIFLDK